MRNVRVAGCIVRHPGCRKVVGTLAWTCRVELAFRRGRVHEATIQAGNMRPRVLRAADGAP
jgi:hypothetical protein